MSNQGYIYRIDIGPKFYIGQTTNPMRRKKDHYRFLLEGMHCNQAMCNAFGKYKDFRFRIIEKVHVSKLTEREMELLEPHESNPNCLNILFKPNGYVGKLTADHKEKISAGLTGRTLSEETKRKISLTKKGRKLSHAHREKIAAANRNRTHSTKTKQKMSRKQSEIKGKGCVLISPDGEELSFDTISQAAQYLAYSKSNIITFMNGHKPWPKRGKIAGWTGYVVTR